MTRVGRDASMSGPRPAFSDFRRNYTGVGLAANYLVPVQTMVLWKLYKV